jgi:hypothetical protein
MSESQCLHFPEGLFVSAGTPQMFSEVPSVVLGLFSVQTAANKGHSQCSSIYLRRGK